jgi:hypothetical protein
MSAGAIGMDLKQFLLAFGSDWVTLMSGIASVALTVIGVAKKWEQVPRRAFWLAVAICFLFASARVWTNEHRARLAIQKHYDDLTKSNITGTIDWAIIGTQPNDGSHVGLIASLINIGASSAIDPLSWELKVRGDNATYTGQPNTLLNKDLDFCLGPMSAMRFVRNDALYLKTSKILAMNETTQGFMWFGFKASKAAILEPNNKLILQALSVTGQKIELSITIGELIKNSQQTKFFSGIENPRPITISCKENTHY